MEVLYPVPDSKWRTTQFQILDHSVTSEAQVVKTKVSQLMNWELGASFKLLFKRLGSWYQTGYLEEMPELFNLFGQVIERVDRSKLFKSIWAMKIHITEKSRVTPCSASQGHCPMPTSYAHGGEIWWKEVFDATSLGELTVEASPHAYPTFIWTIPTLIPCTFRAYQLSLSMTRNYLGV